VKDCKTYLITKSEVRAVLTISDALEAVESIFRAYGEGKVQMPPKPYLSFEKGDLRCMPAYAPALGLASVKNVNVHPGNADLPTVMATITLFDPESGFPVAIMDGAYLTAMRTAAAAGVATRYLARSDSEVLGFVGAGRQAQTQLDAMMAVLPDVERVLFYDIDADSARALARRAEDTYGVSAASHDLRQTVSSADVLTTTTPVRSPIVDADAVRPGTHINAIGGDAPGKQELDPAILQAAKLVVDNWEQASHGGEINVALSEGLIGRGDVYADIGQIVVGARPARETDEEITVFDSTGLAAQDLACAAHVYRRLVVEGDPSGLAAVDFMR